MNHLPDSLESMMHRRLKQGLWIVLLIILGGCASTVRHEQTIAFPQPPDEPRVIYVKSITGSLDFRKASFLDIIFGTPSGSDFSMPYGVSALGDKVYIADGPNNAVFVIDTKQETIGQIGGSREGGLTSPIGVAAATDGTVYVTDGPQKKVLVYGPAGGFRFAIGRKGEFASVGGVAVNNDLGRLYVVDTYGHSIHVYNLKSEPLFQFGKEGEGEGQFHFPTNVAIDRKTGNVYVTDTQNFRVQIFDKDGKFLKAFGELGDMPGTFSRPKGIGVDSEGHIYVADAAFNNFQIFDHDGRILMGVGAAGNMPGYFFLPAGLYVDEQDRIYVVDSMNKRVQVFQYLSEKWKKDHPEEYKKLLQPQGQ